MKNWQNTRDIILFFGGLAGVFNETFLSHAERPTLLILFAAMMGLPAFLRTDNTRATLPPEDEDEPRPRLTARQRQDAYERELERRHEQRQGRRHGKDTD